MSTVFIFHGIGGNSEENWFPWLKKELESAGHRAIVPDLPHADTPKLDEWTEHMKKYEESIDNETVFVGHSLGGIFALRLLERMKSPIHATFLVATVTGPDDGLQYKSLMTTFTELPLNKETIKGNAGEIHFLHSDNDPYIPLLHVKELTKKLDGAIEVILGGEHLSAPGGHTEFPLLLEKILSVLS